MWGDEATDSFLKLLSGCQLRQQFLVDAAEAAVAHNQNMVACLGGGGDAALEMRFVITVRDRVHLARVLRRLRRLEAVQRVVRL